MNLPIFVTREEAVSLLPYIKKTLLIMRRLQKEIELIDGIEVDEEEEDISLDYLETQINKIFHKKMYLFNKHWEELLKRGAVIRDIEEGIIEFFSKHKGREILLSWQLGEQDILYWHELNEGHEDRQPIALLEQKS